MNMQSHCCSHFKGAATPPLLHNTALAQTQTLWLAHLHPPILQGISLLQAGTRMQAALQPTPLNPLIP